MMMSVTVAVMMMLPIGIGTAAADMMMVAGLHGADLVGVTHDPGAVFAELAVHHRIAGADLLDALGEGVEHARMVAQIRRLDELDRGMPRRDGVGLGIDALHQDAGEEKIVEDDDPL